MDPIAHICGKRFDVARRHSRASAKASTAHQYTKLLNYTCVTLVIQLAIVILALLRWSVCGKVTKVALLGGFAITVAIAVVLFAAACVPLVERIGRRIRNMPIHKYTDLERPLLRRLSLEASGTYHHVMMVGDLAQNAAEAIGANGLLARAGAYYHDIGKLSNPRFYMENQAGGDNPHDDLPPNISRMIITNHVKEGMVLAKLNRIPRSVSRFIETHHGTSIVGWFAMKERKRRGDISGSESMDIGNYYRYQGPLPVTREETIVSLADSVEAASRSMRFFDEAKIERIVADIFRDRLLDGQFELSTITLEELAEVRKSFISTLVHLLHGRLPYPAQK